MKDYYQILGVSPNCTDEEIRSNYRKLAMRFHPDRNPDDPTAEERFKEVAEAYGVLTDPVKRREYNACRQNGTTYSSGFSYSQEDILRDLFQDPRFQQMFSGLLREFQKSGFRHNSHFIRKSFFGGKGSMFLGGIFLIGSLAGPLLTGSAKKRLTHQGGVLKSISNKVGNLLGGHKKNHGRTENNSASHLKEYDITYHTPLSVVELTHGKTVQILVYGEHGEQTLKVRIPPGSKAGQKLRLKGKGRPGPYGRGDLYLKLEEK
ncbi:DnaJ domain-containing protein [Desulforhopalus singaporensis]|uniref:Curved DNA-binding protein n=1 Tax=Desulforhopalus singaporensis TaxID=91360 RepID=A0A1H0L3Y8_9BACT|nr:DnaJ domain-containing protein [Desulforhopalus singaporensis]SDO62795.1 curved DNA-binding protein [Desulforhopalus singaporensis]